jgi:hypothetical protein
MVPPESCMKINEKFGLYMGECKMAKKAKKLCTWKKKDVAKNFDTFADIVKNPKFVCKKCGWVSTKKMYLHKPAVLK